MARFIYNIESLNSFYKTLQTVAKILEEGFESDEAVLEKIQNAEFLKADDPVSCEAFDIFSHSRNPQFDAYHQTQIYLSEKMRNPSNSKGWNHWHRHYFFETDDEKNGELKKVASRFKDNCEIFQMWDYMDGHYDNEIDFDKFPIRQFSFDNFKKPANLTDPDFEETGTVSWYTFESCRRDGDTGTTKSRTKMDETEFTIAHNQLPFGTIVDLTYEGKTVRAMVTDTGGYDQKLDKNGKALIADLSKSVFQELIGKNVDLGTINNVLVGRLSNVKLEVVNLPALYEDDFEFFTSE